MVPGSTDACWQDLNLRCVHLAVERRLRFRRWISVSALGRRSCAQTSSRTLPKNCSCCSSHVSFCAGCRRALVGIQAPDTVNILTRNKRRKVDFCEVAHISTAGFLMWQNVDQTPAGMDLLYNLSLRTVPERRRDHACRVRSYMKRCQPEGFYGFPERVRWGGLSMA